MGMLMRQFRELGVGFVVIDQQCHLVASSVLGNCFSTICLSQTDPSSRNKAQSLCGLDENEKKYLGMLEVGQGIVKLAGRWTEPALIQFPLVPVRKGSVTDSVLKKFLIDGWRSESWKQLLGVTPQKPLSEAMLSDAGLAMMRDVTKHKYDGVAARYRRLGMSAEKGQKAKEELLAKGWVKQEFLKHGQTRKALITLTRLAEEALGRLSGSKSKTAQKVPSITHEYWNHWCRKKCQEAGYETRSDAPRKGGRVDCLAWNENDVIGIEIETGKSDFTSNALNGLRSGFSRILIVATDKLTERKIKAKLEKEGLAALRRVTLTTGPQFEDALRYLPV